MTDYLPELMGGALIGLSAALYLLLTGRVAGISGLVGRLFQPGRPGLSLNLAFLVGLLAGPVLYLALSGAWPQVRIEASLWLLGLAGLLVGFGSRMGSGCTSGHGVVGLARLSPRSIVAVLTFMATAILTVFLMRLGGVS